MGHDLLSEKKAIVDPEVGPGDESGKLAAPHGGLLVFDLSALHRGKGAGSSVTVKNIPPRNYTPSIISQTIY